MNDMTKIKEAINLLEQVHIGEREENEYEGEFEIGKNYFIQTVTMYYVGKLTAVEAIGIHVFLKLKKASWIADTGRFHTALKNGNFEEVEPYVNDVCVSVGAIVSYTPWHFELPKEQK